MDNLKSNQVVLQLIVAFILTLLAAVYMLSILIDALKVEGSVKVIAASSGLLVLVATDIYIGYQIVKIFRGSKDELEDS